MGRQGKFDAAIAQARKFLSHSPNPFSKSLVAYLQAAQGDYASAEEAIIAVRGEESGNLLSEAISSVDLSSIAAVRGQIESALGHLEAASGVNEQRGLPQEALRIEVWASFLESRVRGDHSAARARLLGALERFPLADMDTLDRPYAELAEGFAAADDPEMARRLMEEMDATFPRDLVQGTGYSQFKLSVEHPDRALGEIALAEGRAREAIEDFRRSDTGYCQLCALPALARAYEAAGEADSTRVVYERYLDTPESFRLSSGDAFYRGPLLERLGQLYDEQREFENAAKYYAMFVELWAEADPELGPRVQAAQARLEEILAERG